MVGVHVGGVDLVDLLGLVARGFQVAEHIAQGRAKQAGGPGVHQHQFAAGVDQVGIDGGFHHFFQKTLLQSRRHGGGFGVGQQFEHRKLDGAVRQGGDFEVTHHHPVIPGRLGLDHRRLGEGRGAERTASQ